MTHPLDEAVRALRAGGLVVYPTDTLWGLGARIDDPPAVERVFEVKGRPQSEPLSIALAKASDIANYAHVTPTAESLFRLLPGPLTLVLDRKPTVPDVVTGGHATVGIRVPAHPVALQLIAAAGPLTATSANLHRGADPRTLEDARAQLGDRVDYYLRAASPPLGAASTLVDARGPELRILRPGVLSEAELRGSPD